MILFKKAVRSILENKKAYLSCIVLIAISVMMVTAMGGASRALSESSKKYYKEYRLADIFAKVSAINQSEVDKLKEIDGIDEVNPRITYDGRVIFENNSKNITLRLISYDKDYENIRLNEIKYGGTGIENENDILVGQAFLQSHNLKPGDNISIIVEGKEIIFNIVSGVTSPEYVYAIKNSGELLPDNEAFNIAFVDLKYISTLLNKNGIYNDLSFSLKNGYSFDDVKIKIEEELKPFGIIELVKQKDQISVKMLDAELKQIASMSSSVPFVFSGMAGVVLYLMLKRIIEQERGQIGTLKAFGYSTETILIHYIFYGIITSSVGGVIGVYFGNSLVKPLIVMYSEYFTLPNISTKVPIDLAVVGFTTALATGLIGAYTGAKSVLKLTLVDAMKPPAPPVINKDVIESFPFLKKVLSSRGNMALRNIARAKVRSVFIVVGIIFSFGMIATIASMNNQIDFIIFNKFKKSQVYDAKIFLNQQKNINDIQIDVNNINGVYYSEIINEVPAEVRSSNITKGTQLIGIDSNSKLYKLYDDITKDYKTAPNNSIILNKMLADKLKVTPGDYVYVKTSFNEDEIKLLVSETINQNMSMVAYIELNSLNKILMLPQVGNSILVKTNDLEYLKKISNDGKNISAIEDTTTTIKNFDKTLQTFSSMIGFLYFMAIVIAFAIIYNTSTISLSEKQREYATLRVLGLQVSEVGEILSFEYWTLFIFGVIFGIPFTGVLRDLLNKMVQAQMDSISLPTTTSLEAYTIAFLGCMIAVMLSNFSAKQNIKKFDMVEVLKERE